MKKDLLDSDELLSILQGVKSDSEYFVKNVEPEVDSESWETFVTTKKSVIGVVTPAPNVVGPSNHQAMAVSGVTMWWPVVLGQVLLCAEGMHLVHERHYMPTTEVSCIEYGSFNRDRIGRMLKEGWRSQNPMFKKMFTKRSAPLPVQFSLNTESMSRRMDNVIDNIIPRSDNLLNEHAKLVQDINSLRQVVFIAPFIDENKDYDESIFHEIIETAPPSTSRPPSLKPFISSTRSPTSPFPTKGSSIPIILLGGASQRQVVKSQPINFAKPTVSLVGTTISPLIKHPYPFVMHSAQRKPIKICMSSIPPMFSTTKRPPTFWDRLLDYFIPSRSLGR